MKTSENGIEFIKREEGFINHAYKAVPWEKYWTIGYGHYGADVQAGAKISKEGADALLRSDLPSYEAHVSNTGLTLSQNEFDALVSFTYNCGGGNLRNLIRNRTKLQIADALLLYNKSGGKTLAGLVKRRQRERELFLTPDEVLNPLDEIAYEVIEGLWGNGPIRVIKLKAAGYDYKSVQKRVNEIIALGNDIGK